MNDNLSYNYRIGHIRVHHVRRIKHSYSHVQVKAQCRQSAKLFLQSLEFGLPQPLTCTRVFPSPFGSLGRGTFDGERGGGRVPIPTRGHTLLYSLYVCTLWVKVRYKLTTQCMYRYAQIGAAQRHSIG